MIVRESIEFKRGSEPKTALGLGNRELMKKDPVQYLKPLIKERIKDQAYNYMDDISFWHQTVMGDPNSKYIHFKLIVSAKDRAAAFRRKFKAWWKEMNFPFKITEFKIIQDGDFAHIFDIYADEID